MEQVALRNAGGSALEKAIADDGFVEAEPLKNAGHPDCHDGKHGE